MLSLLFAVSSHPDWDSLFRGDLSQHLFILSLPQCCGLFGWGGSCICGPLSTPQDSNRNTGETLNHIFDKHPEQWGLRGDPSLWAELQTHFNSNEIPSSVSEFRAQLETIIQQLTGCELDSDDAVFVPRYDAGGMSSGHVSPEFWREFAIPLLCERFGKTVE